MRGGLKYEMFDLILNLNDQRCSKMYQIIVFWSTWINFDFYGKAWETFPYDVVYQNAKNVLVLREAQTSIDEWREKQQWVHT